MASKKKSSAVYQHFTTRSDDEEDGKGKFHCLLCSESFAKNSTANSCSTLKRHLKRSHSAAFDAVQEDDNHAKKVRDDKKEKVVKMQIHEEKRTKKT